MDTWKNCSNLVSLQLVGKYFLCGIYICMLILSFTIGFNPRYREDDFQDEHAAPYQVLLDTGGFIYSPSKSCIIAIGLPALCSDSY